MNILLINLTRFGDLLQSQAAIHDLVAEGHRVGVVCLQNFYQAASMLDGISYVTAVPGASILSALDENAHKGRRPDDGAGSTTGWHEALAALGGWRNELRAAFQVDAVCNLTPSISARMLARYVAEGRPGAGFFLDEHGFGIDANAWAGFLHTASYERGVSPFNVVDLFRKAAFSGGITQSGSARAGDASLSLPDAALTDEIAAMLHKSAPPQWQEAGGERFVAFQLGASEERRRWPVAFFAELGAELWEKAAVCPVLLGSPQERVLAEEYAHLAQHPFIDCCGKTGLLELEALLQNCSLLVTNDTGTMHLAAGLGRPVLAIFLATAQPFDTGPYCEGACSLEPDMPCHPCAFGSSCEHGEACRTAISPDSVAALALCSLRGEAWHTPIHGIGARVWRSTMDEKGCMSLASLSGHETQWRVQWLMLLRHYMSLYFDAAQEYPVFPLEKNACPPEEFAAISSALSMTESFLSLFVQQGKVLLLNPVPMMRERFMATWDKVSGALRSTPKLAMLAAIWERQTQADEQPLADILAGAERFLTLVTTLRGHFIEE